MAEPQADIPGGDDGDGGRRPVDIGVDIGLVQINNSFSGQNYLPYSIACLEGYVRAHAADAARYRFREPVYKRMPIRDIVDSLAGTDVAGFSTYVWNEQISLETARRLKARSPETLVVFGGPQVPDDPEAFLRDHPFIDLAVHNEGERTFLDLLERWPSRDWAEVPGVSFVDPSGRFVKTPPRERIRDLLEVPSPFLNGMFDALMSRHPEESWIGLWETNRGCPFQCTFCDWGSATAGKVTKFEMERLQREIDWFVDNRIEYVFVCDANFGSQKRDQELADYVAERRRATGYPQGFSVQNTKNATERAYLTQKTLSDAGLNKGVALSMQSLDPTTLRNIKRDNISLDTYLELARRFMKDRVETYSDLILALPGETYDSFCNGVDTLIEAGQHNRIQFNNLSILPNAEMGSRAYLDHHGMKTVRTEIVNIHGSREELDDDVPEYQQLVVATASMPEEDWRRTRAFGWMAAFLHFDKLFQIPLVLAHELTGLAYRTAIEGFLSVDAGRYPVLGGIRDLFLREARAIQDGGPEYVYSKDWLGIFWPADEYALIQLTVEEKLDAFYDEASALLLEMVGPQQADGTLEAIRDAARLNRALLKQPFVDADVAVDLSHDVLAFWRGVLSGDRQPLVRQDQRIVVRRSAETWPDFQRWCREVVWWGNKKGAYLYGNHRLERQLAGHF